MALTVSLVTATVTVLSSQSLPADASAGTSAVAIDFCVAICHQRQVFMDDSSKHFSHLLQLFSGPRRLWANMPAQPHWPHLPALLPDSCWVSLQTNYTTRDQQPDFCWLQIWNLRMYARPGVTCESCECRDWPQRGSSVIGSSVIGRPKIKWPRDVWSAVLINLYITVGQGTTGFGDDERRWWWSFRVYY